jgi:plastocyanin
VDSNPIARFSHLPCTLGRVRNGAVGVLLAAVLLGSAAPAGAGTAATKLKAPTKVTVLEFEYGFKLSRKTMPAGRVTFVMANGGAIVHNFAILNVRAGPYLVSGQRQSMTVTMKKGRYTYLCSVKYHAAQGMQGTIQVT